MHELTFVIFPILKFSLYHDFSDYRRLCDIRCNMNKNIYYIFPLRCEIRVSLSLSETE